VDLGIKLGRMFFPEFDYDWLAREFRINLPLEIDFRLEAKNAERAGALFKDQDFVCIPKIYSKYVAQ
jgi:predicted unusual protein kinase regulating ubiquinone biosynthesis (AarF/ABC1/UbiB family)